MEEFLFLNESHRLAVEGACSGSKSPFSSGQKCMFYLSRLGVGYLELLEWFGGTRRRASNSHWHEVKDARVLASFCDKATSFFVGELNLLLDRARNCSFHSASKEHRRKLKEIGVLLEACRGSVSACLSILPPENRLLQAFVSQTHLIDKSSPLNNRYLDACNAVQNGWECNIDIGRSKAVARAITHNQEKQANWDVFVMDRFAVALFLAKISRHCVVKEGTEMCYVALDTDYLDDHKALMSMSGSCVRGLWWCGGTASEWPANAAMEKYEFDWKSGKVLRSCKYAWDETRAEFVGGRTPKAFCKCFRYMLFSTNDNVEVCVDVGISFQKSGSLLEMPTLCDESLFVPYPYAVVSFLVKSARAPSWLATAFKWDELRFAPHFCLHAAAIAAIYGDEEFVFALPEKDTDEFRRLLTNTKSRKKQLHKGVDEANIEHIRLEEEANRVLFLSRNANQGPKVYMTTERTMVAWADVAIFVGLTAVTLFSQRSRSTNYGGLVASGAAIIFVVYALVMWWWRSVTLREGVHLRPFIDRAGPW
jgi:hypothetical protein